ncbi:MAG: DUF4369 domain-containing protein [Bacteroidales bacterium]|nr:DUF4369 domain-containing protein [Candidatus Colimorpha onthohippi]
MKLNITSIFVAAALFVACGHDDSFVVKGTINGGAGKMLYVTELAPREQVFIDSVRLDDKGSFQFQYSPKYESFFELHASESDYIMLLPERGEDIELQANIESLETTYEVRGSQGSMLLWQLQNYTNEGNVRLREIVALDKQNKEQFANDEKAYKKAKQVTDSMYWDAYWEQSDYIKHFIEENQGSLATLIALYKPFGPNHPLIDIQRDPSLLSYFDMVLEGLRQRFPDNPHTAHFQLSVEHLQRQYDQYMQRQAAQQQQLTVSVGN